MDLSGGCDVTLSFCRRGYDFAGVLSWFAERADRIILLFDAHKLDISDEFKQAIQAIRKQEDKIRIVLNKVDTILLAYKWM